MNHLKTLIPLFLFSLFLVACGGSNHTHQNTPPQATPLSFSTQAETTYSGSLMGTDAEMNTLTFAVATMPTQGMLTLHSNGTFTYIPNADVTGADNFTFTVSDGKSTSTAAEVDITIDLLTVSFNDYSRAAFMQAVTADPLALNSRSVTQDVTDETAYDDLLMP